MHRGFRIAALACLLSTWGYLHADVSSRSTTLDTVRDDLNNGRADQGLQSLNEVLAQQPKNAEALNLRCRIYMQEKRWDDAVASCKSAVAITPGNSDYNLWLARAMGEKADRVSFITAYRMAKQIHQE